MTTKSFEVAGQGFAAAAQSGIRKSLSPDLPDPRMAVLTEVRMSWDKSDEGTISSLNKLLLARQAQNDEIDGLFEKWQSDIRANLERDHEDAKAACLEHLKKIEDAEGELQILQGKLNDLAQDVFKRESALTAAIEARNSLSPYASKKEAERMAKAVADSESRLDEIQARSASLEDQKRQIVLETLPRLKEKLMQLTSEERRAASAITGQPFHHETGLMLPGGSTF